MLTLCRSALAVAVACLGATAGAAELEIVNRTTLVAPIDSDGDSSSPCSVSADGRFALFSSRAGNLVAGDTNRRADLFLHDAAAQTLERVSLGVAGAQADGDVGTIGGVSDDGRYVVFDSTARNLAPGATNGVRQIYLRDRTNGTTTVLSQRNGNPAINDSANPRITGDARYVVFDSYTVFDASDTNFDRDVYRLDRTTGAFELVSVSADGRAGNAASYEPQISADGGSVLFHTWANNLVVGDTNNIWDLVLRKPAAGSTTRISVSSNGAELDSYTYLAPQALSADGRYALFVTYDPAEPGDTNGVSDGYRYDNADGSVERVTLGAGGAQLMHSAFANTLSADGQTLLMQTSDPTLSGSTNNVGHHYLRNLASGAITIVPFRPSGFAAADETEGGMLSGDGMVVFASSRDDDLVDDDRNALRDVFRQAAGAPGQRLSVPHPTSAAAHANGHSGDVFKGIAASEDGRWIAFGSDASNLVVGDFNGTTDVFLRDRLLGMTQRISVRPGGVGTTCSSYEPALSRDGRFVVFTSCDALLPNVSGFSYELYRYDRQTSQLQLVSQSLEGFGAGASSGASSISDDGRFVAFHSSSSSLVAGDDNGYADIFVRDMATTGVTLVTRGIGGVSANWSSLRPLISGDGRHVAFDSYADNLVAGDGNAANDGFLFDRSLQTLERVTLSNAGLEPDGDSYVTGFSRDGRVVAFSSWAANLQTGPDSYFTGAYVRDVGTATTSLVSRGTNGEPLNGSNNDPVLSADGNRVAFVSSANTPYDPAQAYRIYLYERDRGRASRITGLGEYDNPGLRLVLSGDGENLLFSSSKVDLVADDGNNQFFDVFLARKLIDYLFADGYESSP